MVTLDMDHFSHNHKQNPQSCWLKGVDTAKYFAEWGVCSFILTCDKGIDGCAWLYMSDNVTVSEVQINSEVVKRFYCRLYFPKI